MNLIKRSFLPVVYLLTTLLSAKGHAQSQDCKARVRANRGHTFSYSSFNLLEAAFSNNNTFNVINKGAYDSVFVQTSSGFTTSFLASCREATYGTQVSAHFIIYNQGEVILTDSLRQDGRKGFRHDYFYMYESDKVAITYNPKEYSRRYSSVKGNDSLMIVTYPSGITRKMVWYDTLGRDSATRLWDTAGVISHYNTRTRFHIYNQDGLLQSLTYDTLMSDRLITCQTAFYPNGSPDSVVYYNRSAPCHNWRYYNEQGVLIKTVRKAPITSFPVMGYGVAEAMPDQAFTFVVQMPDYPGGMGNFKLYINTGLTDLLCKSKVRLKGTYHIRMKLDTDGSIMFIDAKGVNAGALTENFRQLCRSMPKWHPGKRNGRIMKHIFEVVAMVQ